MIAIDLKKNQPQTLILIVTISFILLILYFQLLLAPQLVRLADVFAKVGKVSSDLRSAESSVAKMGQLKNELAAHKEKVDSYEKRLPVEQEIPSLLADLSRMAKSSNIKILGITPLAAFTKEPKTVKKDQIYQEMPVLVNAKSSYHELGQFLANLENADRFIKVLDIDMKSNKLTPKKHDVGLVICTYILLGEK